MDIDMKIMNVEYIGDGQMQRTICLYPKEIHSIREFGKYLGDIGDKFIPLTFPSGNNCVYPYFIAEETCDFYIRPNSIVDFWEEEIVILERGDYDARINELISSVCNTCIHYSSHDDPENNHFRRNLCLDGTCRSYEKIGDESPAWGETEVQA